MDFIYNSITLRRDIFPYKRYAIMPIGKKKSQVHVDKERIPELCCSTVRGFFFSFIVAKHLLG